MSVYDKRVTRDMRVMMLKIHNDLKDIRNTVEECNDMWLSDLRKLEEVIHKLHIEFEFKPPQKTGAYWADWVFAEDVKEEDEDE
jgi:hypothetical protein